MNEFSTKLRDRADRKSRKRDEKKREIADSAIQALKSLGYANTTLRDIALKSDLSLGMLHYYFEDKIELIIYCVRIYKDDFLTTLKAKISTSHSPAEVVASLASGLAASIVEKGDTHRWWYDIRTQAMFDSAFQPVIGEIEAALIGVIEEVGQKVGNADDTDIKYAAVDGVFRYCLQNYPSDRAAIESSFTRLLAAFI